MEFLAAIGQDEEEKNKAQPEAAVQLRTQPRRPRPRPVSAIFPAAPAKTETPVPAPRWVARRPLSADLTLKFESIGLSLHRKSPKASTPTEQVPPQDKEQDKTPSSSTPESTDGVADPAHSDQNDKKTEETAGRESEEVKPVTSIKSRISLLLDSSSSLGAAADLPSPVQPVPEAETSVGVKQLIKQLTEDTMPSPIPAVKPALKPRPLPLDLTKKFSSERLPDPVSLTEAADRHDISKDPQRGAEESTSTLDDHKMFLDFKDSPSELRKVLTPEGSEAGQPWAHPKESGSGAELRTVRASLFENIVERQSVFMMDQDESASTPKDSPGGTFFTRRNEEDDGSLVIASYREPASPSDPFWVSHAFDTVQAAEENRAVSESVPAAQWEDKAMTLRTRRSERARPGLQTDPASAAALDPQPRYLRVGALQKWTTTGFDQGGGPDKGMLQESEREGLSLEKDQDEAAAAPKRLKMLQGEEQQKPRATYFALTGQLQELASPGGGGISLAGAGLHFDELSVRSALGGSLGQIYSARRNPSLEEAFGQISPSQEKFDEFTLSNHVPCMEFSSQMEEQTKEDRIEVKKKKEQQERERHMAKMNELESGKQKQLETEKQVQVDFERMKEWERQREFERQRQKAFEKEKKELEEKRQRLLELEKQKQEESERERQRQLQKEKRELEREREKEKQREREEKQKEMEMQQLVELERQSLREKAEKEAEKSRQMALEQELLKIKELEKRAKQKELEKQRQREMEKKRQQDMERQQLERERLRREQENERKRKEMERQQLVELEKQRSRERAEKEAEKLRQMALEQEMLKIRELEKEKERQQELEMERQLEMKMEKERELEKQRQRQLDMERQQLENERLRREQEQERKRKEELERAKEMERQQLAELEKQRLREKEEKEAEKLRQMALEQEMLKIKELEKERVKQRELEMEHRMEIETREREKRRQREAEKEKQRQLDLERQQFENERLRREQEKERQRKELERLKELELEKHQAKERMQKAEAEKMRHIAKQQEAERQRLRDRQKKEEQEKLWLESSVLRPKVLDLDSVLRRDPLSPASPQHSDASPRWREPYKPAILDIDSFTSHSQGSPSKDSFPAPGIAGLDAEFGVWLQPTPERDVSWKVPAQNSVGFLSPVWMTSPQDPWELLSVEMSVDKPATEPKKAANKLSPEQLLFRQEEWLPSPQRHRPALPDEPLFLSPPSGKEPQTRNSPHELSYSSLGDQIWIPREPQPPKERRGDSHSHRRSQGSQELNRMRSRSMSRRSAPSSSTVEGSLLRMRSRSAHREQDHHSLWDYTAKRPHRSQTGECLKPALVTDWLALSSLHPHLQAEPSCCSVTFPTAAVLTLQHASVRTEDTIPGLPSPQHILDSNDSQLLQKQESQFSSQAPLGHDRSCQPWAVMEYLGDKLSVAHSQVSGWMGNVRRSFHGALSLLSSSVERGGRGEDGTEGFKRTNSLRSLASRSRESIRRFSLRSQQRLSLRRRTAPNTPTAVQQKQSGEADPGTPVRDTDSQYGTWETGLRTDDSLTPATPSSESNLSPSPRKRTPLSSPGEQASQLETTTTDGLSPSSSPESQPLNFPDAPTTLLDNSALRSRSPAGEEASPRTRRQGSAAECGARLRQMVETQKIGFTETQQSQRRRVKMMIQSPRSRPKELMRGLLSHSAQRVALFPGVDPFTLKAQLKKRGDSDNQTDGPVPSPSHLSRSPKSPFLPRAARVLPPPGGKENGQEDSPQWLKELKSKKRLSHYENES
ncbi:LOW QUALITY PROTEIN: uncharacterized protein FYW61_015548 [Anableps anableps]